MSKKAKKKRKCHGTNDRGKPCGAYPLKPGTTIEGFTVKGDHCRRHDPDLPEWVRFGSHAQAKAAGDKGGRPRNPRPTEVMRRLVEEHVQVVMAPHFRTLGYDVVRDEKSGELTIVERAGGGAKLHGESKEGVVKVSGHDDLGAHMEAAEKLLDRIYGRPKQQTELTGAQDGPIEIVTPVKRPDTVDVSVILSGTGAVRGDG